ncbi:MAG TPA: CopG family antitoxin [Pyrinomonadaceae bacterium]|jgi:hypothetical protein|nr:CopG family antitoxin [Pyrinomonadaceae bacterium]
MAENDSDKRPEFKSLDELVDFFDSHDMGDIVEDMPETHFDVNLQRTTHLVAIDEEVSSKLTEIAEREHVPAQSLVNDWLREKLSGYSGRA